MPQKDIIEQVYMFNVYRGDKRIPKEVLDELDILWSGWGLKRLSYTKWDSSINARHYPVIDKFLKEYGVTECIVRYWW